ncbi:hypothetical protein DPEC_G00236410 [Dallia pectoralis]|uniref:Uncharacterized protein n=1 Tax=Dallia pectoralis TaxID=75939 RepID=A0ACC2FYB2_DALPE|nr:hypothetical protein DPEC_G00236410 [Dallia pectoralis]
MAASDSHIPTKLGITLVVIVVVALQLASTTGLLVLNMTVDQVRSQEVEEKLHCLKLLNALEKDEVVPDSLAQLFGEPCMKLATEIRAYITKVTESILSKHAFPEPRANPPTKPVMAAGNQKPSAHLTLRDNGLQGPVSMTPQKDLHQSCRHPVRSWGNQSFGSHLRNMTLSHGRLRIPRSGRYYLYSQMYFRYPSLSQDHQWGSSSYQLVQCVYKKTSYAKPIQLLKAVGTKCWSPDTYHALQSVHQGGLFELRAGDEIFISVSSPTAIHAEDTSSYFGAFAFDL